MQTLQFWFSELVRLLFHVVDLFLHLDKHLNTLILQFGNYTYGILFLIIFCETGLVVMPLLPGDSLLFAIGTFCAMGSLKIPIILPLLCAAAILGDAVNYSIGKQIGQKVFTEDYRFLRRDHLVKTQKFYEKYGGKTIIFARFVPIVRTFAPFLAGVGQMSYPRFAIFNVVGGIVWVVLFTLAGYFFGSIPVVRKNFTLAIFAIIFVSILPPLIEVWRVRCQNKNQNKKTGILS